MFAPNGLAKKQFPGGLAPVIGLHRPMPPVMSGSTRKPFTGAGRYLLIVPWFSSRSHGATTLEPVRWYPNLASFTNAGDSVETTAPLITIGRWKFRLLHVLGKPSTVSSEETRS